MMTRRGQAAWLVRQAGWNVRHAIRHNVLRKRVEISIVVPYNAPRIDMRASLFAWTRRYLRHALPHAEIIVGHDSGKPFSKSAAVNHAARHAHGDVLVIIDSDAYLHPDIIREAVRGIRVARAEGRRLWYVPYRNFYRLTEDATALVLRSRPGKPYRFPSPPPLNDVEHTHPPNYGHHYGAMCLILPTDAFRAVGGMDTRFRGWGSEDISFMFAVDTLWGQHKTIAADIFHLWHPRIGGTFDTTMWPGQDKPMQHHILGSRYSAANHDYKRMRALVDEFLEGERRDSPGL